MAVRYAKEPEPKRKRTCIEICISFLRLNCENLFTLLMRYFEAKLEHRLWSPKRKNRMFLLHKPNYIN